MENLRRLREKANLTQQDVAAALGITRSAVSRWESGRKKPSSGRLLRLAKLYGCTVEDLLTNKAM